jgi:hypothetical protein
MGRKPIRDEYFSWLYAKIENRHYSYTKLCRVLHDKKFVWSVNNDDNRCNDGIALRDRFIDEERLDESHLEVLYLLKEPCSVLEVMVALAERMNDIMYDLNDTQRLKTPKFFHQMLVNLNLNRFVDGYNLGRDFDPVSEAEIDEILEIWLGRTYGVDGRGGLFPIRNRHRQDQSQVELWYQMQLWLEENYG